jgi:hypothetical protein
MVAAYQGRRGTQFALGTANFMGIFLPWPRCLNQFRN